MNHGFSLSSMQFDVCALYSIDAAQNILPLVVYAAVTQFKSIDAHHEISNEIMKMTELEQICSGFRHNPSPQLMLLAFCEGNITLTGGLQH